MADEYIFRELARAKELLPRLIVRAASGLFASETGLSGTQIFDFFGQYSGEVGKLRYGPGAPSRWKMFEKFLESLPIEQQRAALLELCNGYPVRTPPRQEEVEKLKDKICEVPVPAALGKAIEKVDISFVTKHWEKITERLAKDPDGAITSARTLVETVCLYILDGLGKSFDHRGDLPALYKATAAQLQLLPKKEDEEIIRQILGSCRLLRAGSVPLPH